MTLRTWLTAALTALTLSACNDTARDDNDYGPGPPKPPYRHRRRPHRAAPPPMELSNG